MMLNIVLFGAPGAGKGTQSEKLIEKYQLQHISTGDLFRKHLKEGTSLGNLAKQYMDAGNLVPDQVVVDMVEDKIKSDGPVAGYIFDGFPRTIPQAEALDKLLARYNTAINVMIALEVPEEELKARMIKRAQTSGRADDADPAIQQKRIDVYKNETFPLKDFYNKQGKKEDVDGIGTIDEIFGRICEVVDRHS